MIISDQCYIIRRKFKALLSGIPYLICGCLPIKNSKIVFSAFEGAGFCCNPKYIANELIRRENNNGVMRYEMIWLVNDTTKIFPREIKKVKNNLWNRAYHLSTAHIWIDNARKRYGTRKRKGQFYILTWHGPIGFKPVGRLRGSSFSKIAEIVSKYDAKRVDLLLSNSEWCSQIWRTAFWNEPIELLGSPRCDILINNRNARYREVRKEFGLPENAKIVMYAPTFRGGSQNKNREVFIEESTLDLDRVTRSLNQRFGGEWYIFLRMHPQLTLRNKKCDIYEYENVIDVSMKDDLYEILAGIDAFISDYSSAAFDASYMRIPVFLYVDDLEDYIGDRGSLTWKMEEIPFPMAKDNDEFDEMICNFDIALYEQRIATTFNKIGLLEDGRASYRVAEKIEQICIKNEWKV